VVGVAAMKEKRCRKWKGMHGKEWAVLCWCVV